MSTSFNDTDLFNIAAGKVAGKTAWNKWGYNGTLTVSVQETIWEPGGIFVPMVAADTLTITSASALDIDTTGTGAQKITIWGVDANWDERVAQYSMNGATGTVTTGDTWLGINRVSVFLAGSTQQNQGKITIAPTATPASIQATIPALEGSTQQAFFFVPNGKQALMDWLYLGIVGTGGAGKICKVEAWVTSTVSNAKYLVMTVYLDDSIEGHLSLLPDVPFVVGQKSLIEFRATFTTGAGAVNCRFSHILTGV